MGLLLMWWWSSLVSLLLSFLVFHANSFNTSNLQLSCYEDERSALLLLKRSFVIDKSTCRHADDYPKASSWDSEGGSGNCCSWDGIECDNETGHVIGLDLSNGCIYGTIYSNNTLFNLIHLQKLSLAYNHFNYSPIPASIGQLSELRYLNLSRSFFFGQVPCEISQLAKLTSLDLSLNYDEYADENLLKLKSPILRSLVQNVTHLESLGLDFVDLLSNIPEFLGNFSSLTVLSLTHTGLCGSIPSSLGKLTQLTHLSLTGNNLIDYIPSSLQNLTQLQAFFLYDNKISGQIPSWLGNLTKIKVIRLSENVLHGSVPRSLSRLCNLNSLKVYNNNLDGNLDFDMFYTMRHLVFLNLGENKLSVTFGARNINATTLPNFRFLTLSSCNISEFPHFLRYQNELKFLDLSNNNISGKIPKWMWNSSVESLYWFEISDNFLTGFHHPPTVLPWVQLKVLSLSSNMLQGQLLIPPSSTVYLAVSNNMLSGEIPPLICKLSSIKVLDLSNNNFNGTVPHCLGNSSSSLQALLLRNNSFHGTIPLEFEKERDLRMIDLSHNQLQGKLPRSLAACMMLEYLDFSSNKLIDVFPAWLGTLPLLKVLFLQKNGFHGATTVPKNTSEFPNLHIIDLSYNNLTGALPSEYIFIWNGMKAFKGANSTYMNVNDNIDGSNIVIFNYVTTITIKGVETYYGKIREELAVVDLSSNKFSGEIPEFIGNLMVVRSLNLSNNMLSGRIPLSIGNLSQLESLDLSHNMLSGEIPQQLAQLNFIQSFRVSHNNLSGPVPQGSQLQTFDPSAFEGNPGLCGDRLPKKCEDSEASQQPPSADDDDPGSSIELDWKFVLAGAISGFIVGVVLGDMVMTKWQGLFLRAFRRIPSRMEIRQLRN